MSVDKLVDSSQLDTDLTSVANAIRTKGGTSAQLAFPAGFVSAIQAIPTGGGGSAETLLGSGTYTATAVASSATISTGITNSDTTKPVKILVVKDSQTSGIGQMLWWVGIHITVPADFVDKAGNNLAKGYYVAANGTSTGVCAFPYASSDAICSFDRSTGKIMIRQYSNNYRVQPDTFHWYVWGEEATA